jgi:taurine dioxygenase
MQVLPNATVGAEVRGVDLARLSAKEIEDIKQAWYRHDVLVCRGQKLSDDDLLAFSKHFGTLDPPPNQGAGRKSPPGYPDIYVVSNVLDDYGEPIGALGDGEAAWHTDMSYIAWPPDASMLYSLEIPPLGGDTSFCSMRVALKKLPRGLLERVKHLDIKHDGTYDSGGNLRKGVVDDRNPKTAAGYPHPAVIRDPGSGKPALFLGRRPGAYVMGLEIEESEKLLDELWKHAIQPRNVYEHKWKLGDVLIWSNYSTMHRRDEFDNQTIRRMHRSQIKGTSAPAAYFA